jgi:LAO/AO transport system kinase
MSALQARAAWLGAGARLAAARQAQAEAWLRESLRDRFGRVGMARAGRMDLILPAGRSPFSRLAELSATIER